MALLCVLHRYAQDALRIANGMINQFSLHYARKPSHTMGPQFAKLDMGNLLQEGIMMQKAESARNESPSANFTS